MKYYRRKRYLIHDRDPLYTTARFREILKTLEFKQYSFPPEVLI